MVRSRIILSVAMLSLAVLTRCAGHKQARIDVPPPPPAGPQTPVTPNPTERATTKQRELPAENESAIDDPNLSFPADAVPLLTEIGLASWYGAPYHNRRGSNGEVYNMHAMTAAHRTLPLGSIVRVTNLKTNHAALVRITDRGPFVEGRILDLSYAAAKKVDIWQPGVASVKIEVMQTPVASARGGRWA